MLLKDRHRNDSYQKGGFQGKSKCEQEPCKRFNKGHCSYGLRCKFDHRCSIPKCGKFGHGAHNCRIRLAEEKGETVAVKEISIERH